MKGESLRGGSREVPGRLPLFIFQPLSCIIVRLLCFSTLPFIIVFRCYYSWEGYKKSMQAEELHGLYSAMALLVCLGAAATAYSATQAKLAVSVLAGDWVRWAALHCDVGAAATARAASASPGAPSATAGRTGRRWRATAASPACATLGRQAAR